MNKQEKKGHFFLLAVFVLPLRVAFSWPDELVSLSVVPETSITRQVPLGTSRTPGSRLTFVLPRDERISSSPVGSQFSMRPGVSGELRALDEILEGIESSPEREARVLADYDAFYEFKELKPSLDDIFRVLQATRYVSNEEFGLVRKQLAYYALDLAKEPEHFLRFMEVLDPGRLGRAHEFATDRSWYFGNLLEQYLEKFPSASAANFLLRHVDRLSDPTRVRFYIEITRHNPEWVNELHRPRNDGPYEEYVSDEVMAAYYRAVRFNAKSGSTSPTSRFRAVCSWVSSLGRFLPKNVGVHQR